MSGQRSGVATPDGRSKSSSNQTGARSGYASPAVQSVQSSRPGTIINTLSGPGGPKPKMVARGGAKDIAANSNTKELADFFKGSAPDDSQSAPAPVVGRNSKLSPEESKRIQKQPDTKKKMSSFFSRAKKKTYLDMP